MAQTLQELLGKIDAGWRPKALAPDEELRRVRAILAKLGEKCSAAAEERYPGIGDVIARFLDKEEVLSKACAEAPLSGLS